MVTSEVDTKTLRSFSIVVNVEEVAGNWQAKKTRGRIHLLGLHQRNKALE
jgi:hypothetical protein